MKNKFSFGLGISLIGWSIINGQIHHPITTIITLSIGIGLLYHFIESNYKNKSN